MGSLLARLRWKIQLRSVGELIDRQVYPRVAGVAGLRSCELGGSCAWLGRW